MGQQFAAGLGYHDLLFELDPFATVATSNVGLDTHDHSRFHRTVDAPVSYTHLTLPTKA